MPCHCIKSGIFVPSCHRTVPEPQSAYTRNKPSNRIIMKQSIVTGMGEALWDMLPEGKKIGGAPANFAIRNRQPGRECRGKGHGGERAIGELTGQIAERTYRENGLPHRKRRGGSGRKGHPLLQHPGRRCLGPYSLHAANGRTGPPDASRMFRFAGPTASRLTLHHPPVSRHHAGRGRTIQDIRHQPPARFLYTGDYLHQSAKVQHP